MADGDGSHRHRGLGLGLNELYVTLSLSDSYFLFYASHESFLPIPFQYVDSTWRYTINE